MVGDLGLSLDQGGPASGELEQRRQPIDAIGPTARIPRVAQLAGLGHERAQDLIVALLWRYHQGGTFHRGAARIHGQAHRLVAPHNAAVARRHKLGLGQGRRGQEHHVARERHVPLAVVIDGLCAELP